MSSHALQSLPLGEAPRLEAGAVALVTGATSGIGYYTAAGIARLGATVYITGRVRERGEQAERELRELAGHGRVHFIQADASTVGGNQQLAERIRTESDRLHILVNNVGGAYNDRWETADGYEATLAVQFVGPVALTEALLPLLQAAASARIVNVTSGAIAMWHGDPFVDLHSTNTYLGSRAYARSKYLNLLWTLALARRGSDTGVITTAADPGTAWTSMTAGIAPHGMPRWVTLIWPLFRWLQRRGTAKDAARSSIVAATSPEAASWNGRYLGKDGRTARLPASLLDISLQEQAWATGEALVRNAPTQSATARIVQ